MEIVAKLRILLCVVLTCLASASVASADVFNMAPPLISLDTVTVGNAGNSSGADARGGVDYEYEIGVYEVTAAQYTEFLNAVAATDTYGLYSPAMTAANGCQITQAGDSGTYTYSVPTDAANRPVNKVSWADAARFANWLHNGQPTGVQDATTTENGAYALNGATDLTTLQNIVRELDAAYAIANENEWFKAAYHKNDGITDHYWLYPTATDADPTAAIVDPDPGNNANFNQLLGAAPWRTVVGEFENSTSPYGTFDQGGNVVEMTDTLAGSAMVSRGGSYWYNDAAMRKTNSTGQNLSFDRLSEENNLGFRIVIVPTMSPPPTDVFDMGPDLNSLELLPVGNAGNSSGNDGLGGIGYDYQIGKHEITAAQYTVFLNAVAAADTYGLYNPAMTYTNGCQIQRAGTDGAYAYTVNADAANRPVNKVSWADAARFVNWLHNGQPSGAQDLTTTEDGAYYLNGANDETALLAIVREGDAEYAIANESEWFKAAYHKNDGITDNYWLYPTATDADPNAAIVDPDTGNNANYDKLLGAAPWRTVVGEFENSESPYGTYDQAGNVLEMTDSLSGSQMISRGGSYWTNDATLRKTNATGRDLANTRLSEENNLGFRIVTTPPSAPTDVFNMGPDLTSLEMVTVDNPGNANGADGLGGVFYTYDIGKYEITAAQYTVFLNAVAATDTYGLYNPDMTATNGCHIAQSGAPGTYTYSVGVDAGNRPVNKISWADAARFANWLHNGQPSGAQDLTTTEDGAYFLNGTTDVAAIAAIMRENDAAYAIATESEWFKAAYHKNDGITDNYWLYPTGADTDPNAAITDPDTGNNANFDKLLGAAPWRTAVGEFENSSSPYGTFDQAGNILEMTEAQSGSQMICRGGSYWTNDATLRKTNATGRDLNNDRLSEENNLGFRIVAPPAAACGSWGFLAADLDRSCYVDSLDLNIFASVWLTTTDCGQGDCFVDLEEFAVITAQWLQCTDPENPGCTRP